MSRPIKSENAERNLSHRCGGGGRRRRVIKKIGKEASPSRNWLPREGKSAPSGIVERNEEKGKGQSGSVRVGKGVKRKRDDKR